MLAGEGWLATSAGGRAKADGGWVVAFITAGGDRVAGCQCGRQGEGCDVWESQTLLGSTAKPAQFIVRISANSRTDFEISETHISNSDDFASEQCDG